MRELLRARKPAVTALVRKVDACINMYIYRFPLRELKLLLRAYSFAHIGVGAAGAANPLLSWVERNGL